MNVTEILTLLIALSSIITVIYQFWYNSKTIKINTKTLNSNINLMNADFIYRLRDDFYSKKSKSIMFFIENEFIEFKENKETGKEYESYFEINKIKVESLHDHFKVYKKYAVETDYVIHIQDMDNYVLGYLNDIGEYWEKGIIDIDYITNSFEYPFYTLFKNEVIKKYLDKNKYAFIKAIAKEIKKKNHLK